MTSTFAPSTTVKTPVSELMRRENITKSWLTEASGLSRKTVDALIHAETGKSPHKSIRPETVDAIASTFGVSAGVVDWPLPIEEIGKPSCGSDKAHATKDARRGSVCPMCYVERSACGVCNCG